MLAGKNSYFVSEVVVVPVARNCSSKPNKPFPSFPLTPHPNGQWCKKIRGKVHFFGAWADPNAALEKYTRQAADLHAGRKPVGGREVGATIKDIANLYLAAQLRKANRNLIAPVTFDDCQRTIKSFASAVGSSRLCADLTPSDFEEYRLRLYDRFGVAAIERAVTIIRSMFKFAFDANHIESPMRFGGQFNKPASKEKRRERNERDLNHGKRLFSAEEVLSLCENASSQLRAMVFLGINGGFGNSDCAALPIGAVDLANQVIDFARPKTVVQRTVPLWAETVESIKSVLDGPRPQPSKPEYEDLLFLTVFGNPWKQESIGVGRTNSEIKVSRHAAIGLEFGKLLKRLNLNRKGLGFYALRHTFRTWADETRDQHAVHRIMGHAIPGMSGVYVEEISIDRLRAVTDYVHDKLFNPR